MHRSLHRPTRKCPCAHHICSHRPDECWSTPLPPLLPRQLRPWLVQTPPKNSKDFLKSNSSLRPSIPPPKRAACLQEPTLMLGAFGVSVSSRTQQRGWLGRIGPATGGTLTKSFEPWRGGRGHFDVISSVWSAMRADPGPRGVRLSNYKQLEAAGGKARAGWQFDRAWPFARTNNATQPVRRDPCTAMLVAHLVWVLWWLQRLTGGSRSMVTQTLPLLTLPYLTSNWCEAARPIL